MRRRVFTNDHEAFRARVREFLERDVVPEYASWEAAGQPSRDFWLRAGQLGILGIGVPAELGGVAESDFRHSAVVTEEIQRLGLAIGGLRVHTDICMPYFLEYASPAQQQRWLPRLTSGEAVAALALSEPGAGSDMKALSTTAARDGDCYVLNGAKTFISNGQAADLVIVAAKTAPDAGRRGISLLVLDGDATGFQRGRKLKKIGQHAQDLSELYFEDARVPAENLLGKENQGFAYLTSNLAQERLSIGLNSQAAAASTLRRTAAALAGTPVGTEQHTKFELAACDAEVRAGQALVDAALEANSHGDLDPVDAAALKLYCTELQGRVADRCLQLQGLRGFARDADVARAFADARVSRIYGGSSEIMKVIVSKAMGL